MKETTARFDFVPWSCFGIATALLFSAVPSSEHGKLRDEIATFRAEIRCFAERRTAISMSSPPSAHVHFSRNRGSEMRCVPYVFG